MKIFIALIGTFVLLSGSPVFAQHHMSNWVHRTATDTTIVQCWTDFLSAIAFPPNSMNMMMPDSIYCRVNRKDMDSLYFPHDSTFIGWYSVQAGRDSMHFDMMNGDSVYGQHNMMQFMNSFQCRLHWDSLMADSAYRHWHLTGVKGWNGTSWAVIPSVSVSGSIATFSSAQAYSAIAFVGTPTITTAIVDRGITIEEFALYQNYPNPFNPSTTIRYSLPHKTAIQLTVFNMLGQQVALPIQGEQEAGYHEFRFDASGLSSGVYFYKIQAGDYMQTRKLLLVK